MEENCPKCGISFKGDPIPKEHQEAFGATHFSKIIGIEDPIVYDGISWWKCFSCEHVWKRFSWSPEYSKD
jgi:hypothetical protein